MKKLLITGLLLFSAISFAQKFYINKSHEVYPDLFNYLIEVDLNSFEETELFICPFTDSSNGFEVEFTDIAINNDYFYFVSPQGGLYRRLIDNDNSCEFLLNFMKPMNSLVADNEDFVYAAGISGGEGHIYRYDATQGMFEDMGNLPDNILPAGDLFFYDSRLFLLCGYPNQNNYDIYEINMQNPMESCLYMSIGSHNAWGAFSIENGGSSEVYITTFNGIGINKLRQVNMDTKTVGSVLHTFDQVLLGATAAYSLTSTDAVCMTAGINESSDSDVFFTVINPVKTNIITITNIEISEISAIILYDLLGKEIKTFDSFECMNVEGIAQGTYILQCNSVIGKSFTKKIIIQ